MSDAAVDTQVPLLIDQDPEIVLHALEYLSVKDLGRAAQSCKFLAILVTEIARTTTFMVGAVGPLDGLLKDSLDPHLEAAPSMGILFSKEVLKTADLSTLARQLPYHVELVGGHMSVVAGTDAAGALYQTNSVCPHARSLNLNEVGLSLGRFPGATVKSFAIERGNWEQQLEAQGCFETGWKVFLLIARHRDTDEIVSRLQTAHPKAAIIGGIATGHQIYQIRQRTVKEVDEGMVGLMFSGDVPLAAFVSRGARGLGEAPMTFTSDDVEVCDETEDVPQQMLMHVTTSEGVKKNALQAVIESLHASGGGGGGLCLGITADVADGYELQALSNEMVVENKQAILLPPRRGDEPLWENGSVRFYGFDPDSCKSDLTSRLQAIKQLAAEKGDRMLGAVMFTCGGRTHRFFGESAFDATTFTRIFDGVPLIGMYAGGEIGPPLLADAPAHKAFQVGDAGMHGFTAIFGLFIVPKRPPRDTQLAFADAEEVAAAYAELRKGIVPVPPLESAGAAGGGAAGGRAGGGGLLPMSLGELRALPVKALKQAMAKLGLVATPGSEKEDLVQEIAKAQGIDDGDNEDDE